MKTFEELEIIKRSLKNEDTPFSYYGVECGDGWKPLILEALNKMEELDDELYITQIKEKFGGLRLYTSPYKATIENELEEIIAAAEEKASQTCETCGVPGHLRPDGWMRTLCDSCESDYQINNGRAVKKL